MNAGKDALWSHLEEALGAEDEGVLRAFSEAFQVQELGDRDHWITEGAPSRLLGIVVSGELEVLTGEQRVGLVSRGEVIGEISLFDPGAATATVMARGPARVAVLGFEELEAIRARYPRETAQMVRTLCQAMSGRLRSWNEMALKSIEQGDSPATSRESGGWRGLMRWLGGGHAS